MWVNTLKLHTKFEASGFEVEEWENFVKRMKKKNPSQNWSTVYLSKTCKSSKSLILPNTKTYRCRLGAENKEDKDSDATLNSLEENSGQGK